MGPPCLDGRCVSTTADDGPVTPPFQFATCDAGWGSLQPPRSARCEHHHRAEDFAVHDLSKCVLNIVDGDDLRNEAVEVEPSLQIQVDEHREIACWKAVAVPRRSQ